MNILNTLTIKHLKMNKRRTIVTILGIILSTSLMVGIGALVSSFRDVMLRQTIASDGNYHVLLNNFAYQDYKYIEQNASVLSSSLAVPIGFSYLENGKNEYKPYLFFEGVSKSYFKQINLMEGRIPENEKEIIISKHIEADGG
ncbi:MAG: ABC transporter permease, partial [Bacilli bacterium]